MKTFKEYLAEAIGAKLEDLKPGTVLYDKHGKNVDEVDHVRRGLRASDKVVVTRAGYNLPIVNGVLAGYWTAKK